MKKIKDIILIQGIKDGNKKYEKLLYDKYREHVKIFLKFKYPKNKETEDDVSEILIKIFERIDQYDKSKAKFKTWVNKIAKNYMVDKSRKAENKCIQLSFDNANDGSLCLYSNTSDLDTADLTANITTTNNFSPTSYFAQPDQDFENKDALSFISNRIGIEDFHLLNMKYGEGYDYNEMEKEMRVSSNTISNRVNYIKSKLKKKKEGE
jgi:RNA polymerase sigma factor (sigma-70 family)